MIPGYLQIVLLDVDGSSLATACHIFPIAGCDVSNVVLFVIFYRLPNDVQHPEPVQQLLQEEEADLLEPVTISFSSTQTTVQVFRLGPQRFWLLP